MSRSFNILYELAYDLNGDTPASESSLESCAWHDEEFREYMKIRFPNAYSKIAQGRTTSGKIPARSFHACKIA